MQDDLTEAEVRERLAASCAAAGGQNAWARKHEISVGYVSNVLNEITPPGRAIQSALGLERVVRYREVAQ